MRSTQHAKPGSPVSERQPPAVGGTTPAPNVIDLTQADLAQISAARRGAPLPKVLAGKLATIVHAAAQGQRINVTHESAAPVDVPGERRKRIATAAARAALFGATLVELPDDGGQLELILSRWALTRSFRDLDELEATLDRMEGSQR